MYEEDDIIADFTPVVRGAKYGDPDVQPAILRLSSRAVAVQDYAVLSLLLTEKAHAFGSAATFSSSGTMYVWQSINMFLLGVVGPGPASRFL